MKKLFKEKPLEVCFILFTLIAFSWQMYSTIHEWLNQCSTQVSIATHGGVTRLPAMSLCLSLQSMIAFRLSSPRLPTDTSRRLELIRSVRQCIRKSIVAFFQRDDALRQCIFVTLYEHNMTHFDFFNQLVPPDWQAAMPDLLATVEFEFLNGTRYTVTTDFLALSHEVCWTFFTDSNTTKLCQPDNSQHDTCQAFNGYINRFTQNNVIIRVQHENLTVALHSPLARQNRMHEMHLTDHRHKLPYGMIFTFDYDEIHRRDCTSEGMIPCREYSPGNPLQVGDPTPDWTCPLGGVHPLASQMIPWNACDTFVACQSVAGILYAANNLKCMPMMEQSYTCTMDEFNIFNSLDLLPCEVNDSSINSIKSDEMLKFMADLDEGDLCPKECTQLIYKFARSNLPTSKKASSEKHSREMIIELTRSSTPSLSVQYVPRVTDLQFLCNMAAIFGIWYGLSVLSVWRTIIDCLISGRFQKRIKLVMIKRQSGEKVVLPAGSCPASSVMSVQILNQNVHLNSKDRLEQRLIDNAVQIYSNHQSRALVTSNQICRNVVRRTTRDTLRSFNRYTKY